METTSREREKLEERGAKLKSEVLRLKSRYPLTDLLKHKELEIQRALQQLSGLSDTHPERSKLEAYLGLLNDQRDQIQSLLDRSEMH